MRRAVPWKTCSTRCVASMRPRCWLVLRGVLRLSCGYNPGFLARHGSTFEVGVVVDCGSRSPIFLFNLDTQELMGAFTPTASSYAVEPATHRLSLVRPFSPWLAPRPCALALARLPCRPMLATGACCMAYIESVRAATLTTSGPSRPLPPRSAGGLQPTKQARSRQHVRLGSCAAHTWAALPLTD